MHSVYFNHYARRAESRWERRDFVHRWWRINAADRRWTPPDFAALYQALVSQKDAASTQHLGRQHPAFLHVEALQGRPRRDGETMRTVAVATMEEPVAAALVMADPRRRDSTAYLALLTCANDEESLDRLLGAAQETAWSLGCTRLLGPVGLSPYIQAGALVNYFHVTPPLHTPYNAPYLPDVLHASLEAAGETQLYSVAVAAPAALAPDPLAAGPAQIMPLDPARLAGDLLPLFTAALENKLGFPPPDAVEAAFLLDWWGRYPLAGWLAVRDNTPVGFVLCQPDLARLMQATRGGRPLWRRAWLNWRRTHPAQAGRVLAGGVLPAWRNRGIGAQLWRQALAHAHSQDWRTLTVGPLEPQSAAAASLSAHAAAAQQRYTIYATE